MARRPMKTQDGKTNQKQGAMLLMVLGITSTITVPIAISADGNVLIALTLALALGFVLAFTLLLEPSCKSTARAAAAAITITATLFAGASPVVANARQNDRVTLVLADMMFVSGKMRHQAVAGETYGTLTSYLTTKHGYSIQARAASDATYMRMTVSDLPVAICEQVSLRLEEDRWRRHGDKASLTATCQSDNDGEGRIALITR